jgi:hypothetical protein
MSGMVSERRDRIFEELLLAWEVRVARAYEAQLWRDLPFSENPIEEAQEVHEHFTEHEEKLGSPRRFLVDCPKCRTLVHNLNEIHKKKYPGDWK